MNQRWGFDEADDDEFDDVDSVPAAEQMASEDLLTGADSDGIVEVSVTDTGEFVSVSLAEEWQTVVDPRTLNENVLAAANTATMRALGKQVENTEFGGVEDAGTDAHDEASNPSDGEIPITKDYAMRLLSKVSVDVDRFMGQVSDVANRVVSTESDGHHVSASGVRRQLTEVWVDPEWANRARRSEIEHELQDALTSFSTQSSLGELTQGPRSEAIDELMALVSNPGEMVRRIRQRPSAE